MKNKSKKNPHRENIANLFSYKKLLLALVEWNDGTDTQKGHEEWWRKYSFSYNDLIRIANLKLKGYL